MAEIAFWDEEWITEASSDERDVSFHISSDPTSSNYESALEDVPANDSGYISQPSNDYQEFLKEKAPDFMSLDELSKKTPDYLADVTGVVICLYGIIKEVYDLRSESTPYEKFAVFDKYVVLMDPTLETGLRVRLEKPQIYFQVGDILRIRNLQLIQGTNAVEYYTEKNEDLRIIKCLEFSYRDGEVKKDCDCEVELSIAYFLEKWYARKVFTEYRLNKLPIPKRHSPHYVNLVCQVLSKQVLQQSVILRIYDGTVPNRQFNYEDTVKHINALKPLSPIEPRLYRDRTLKLHENISDDKLEYSAIVNVWGNESGMNNIHFNTANGLKLREGNDLLLLLNMEVSQVMDGPLTLLVMRSGRHKGKAVRLVNKDSVLGKMITQAVTCPPSVVEMRHNNKRRRH